MIYKAVDYSEKEPIEICRTNDLSLCQEMASVWAFQHDYSVLIAFYKWIEDEKCWEMMPL